MTARSRQLTAQPKPFLDPVTISKVPNRRRPHIVPIIDSRLRQFYGVRQPQALRAALWNGIQDNREWLSDFATNRTTPTADLGHYSDSPTS